MIDTEKEEDQGIEEEVGAGTAMTEVTGEEADITRKTNIDIEKINQSTILYLAL